MKMLQCHVETIELSCVIVVTEINHNFMNKLKHNVGGRTVEEGGIYSRYILQES